MHAVHTFKRVGVLLTNARTVWMFGLKRRLVRRCEWEIAWPKPGPLPQTSHTAATMTPKNLGVFLTNQKNTYESFETPIHKSRSLYL